MLAPGTSCTPPATKTRRSTARSHAGLKIIQEQAGHSWASTTATYTTVGQDARNRMLRSALARAFEGEDGR
jgi:hypothetical protein